MILRTEAVMMKDEEEEEEGEEKVNEDLRGDNDED